jgi:hypothetical protein
VLERDAVRFGDADAIAPLTCAAGSAAGRCPDRRLNATEKAVPMLETLIVVLVILWLLGLVTSYTLGGFIHALLVIALIVVALRLIRGRRIA